MPPPSPQPSPPSERRRRRRHHNRFKTLRLAAFVALVVLVLLPAVPWLAVALFVDVDTVKAQIEAAALRTTQRTLTLGKVTMLRSLPPTIAAEGVAFANEPGGSRPDMLRVPYAEATFGILPLLFGRLEVRSLLLSRPDLALEADPTGTGNWQFARRADDALLGRTSLSQRSRWTRRHAAQDRAVVTLEVLHIREGRLAWRDDSGDWTIVDVRRLDASSPGMKGPSEGSAQILVGNRTVNFKLSTGRLSELRAEAPSVPWPVRLDADTPGAHASVVGTMTVPRTLRGYALAVEGTAENLGDLQGLLHMRLPPLRKLVFTTHLADSGGPVPILSGISLRARQSDLDSWVPGLSVAAIDLAAESFDNPLHAAFDGTFDRHPLHLAADFGPPAALLVPGRLPGLFPIDLNIQAAGGWLTVKGVITAPERSAGLDLDVAGVMPDLSVLSPLVGMRLPSFRNITLGLHAGDAEDGFRRGIAMRNIELRSTEADLGGNIDIGFPGRTAFRAVLKGRRVDLDAVRTAMGEVPLPPPAPALPSVAAEGGWVVPDGRLPFSAFTRVDFDIRAELDELRLAGERFRNVSLATRLRDGQFALDPLDATLDGGGISLKAALNAHGRFPPVLLSVRAAGVPARLVFGALGLPDDATGKTNLSADFSSAGASWHELAGRLTGQLGFSVSDGELDRRLLEALLGPPLKVIGLQLPAGTAPGGGGRIPVRCLAVRIDSKDGVAAMHDFVLDATSLVLRGEGAVQLRDERLAVRLTPLAIGSAPPKPAVRVGGVFARTTIYPEQGTTVSLARSGASTSTCADALAIANAAMPRPRIP